MNNYLWSYFIMMDTSDKIKHFIIPLVALSADNMSNKGASLLEMGGWFCVLGGLYPPHLLLLSSILHIHTQESNI